MGKPDQFMYQNMLQHWVLRDLATYCRVNPNITLQEINDLLSKRVGYDLKMEWCVRNVYTLTALGYTQLTYAKENGMLDKLVFEASEYGLRVKLHRKEADGSELDKEFKCNEEYENYYNSLEKGKDKKKLNSSMDKFILRYMRNSLAHSEFEMLDSDEIQFKGDIIKGELSYEINIGYYQFEMFMNMLLDEAYGFCQNEHIKVE